MIPPAPGVSYCGPAPRPEAIWLHWNLDPVVLATLALLLWATRGQRGALSCALVLAVIFVSPLCTLTVALFSARVVHHVLLVAGAAPLLALVFPAPAARSPLLPLTVATAPFWLWHLPLAYDLALAKPLAYWAMQLTLGGSEVWLWRRVLHPDQPSPVALLAVFGSLLQMALLGALLTLAPRSLYAIHATAPLDWGLTPLADQQLGGLIMWVPAALPYLAIAALLARRGWRDQCDRCDWRAGEKPP